MKDHRKEKRESAKGSVEYTFASEDSEIMHTGLLSDLSKDGACIFTQERITDDKLKVYLKGLIDDPMNADVIWCSEAMDNLYRVGVMFQS